ncbi:hypothetical protein [Maricaulis maris]|uniref:SpoIIAA-like protein n=1 Tax=Maricaulis maris TaxID=74318 RepID=A0A495D314_9PROT|nr:hypothetical protein [Maricaulis maris]RKQ95330.1 hypothetical protein C7435_3022 [Maricaulis maris]
MKASYHVNVRDGLIIYTMSGTLTSEGILKVFRAAISDPDWSREFDMMCLFHNADFSVFSLEEAASFSKAIQALDPAPGESPPIRSALVCPDDLSSALLTFWEMMGRDERRAIDRIFATEAEARAWLAEPR